MRDSAADLERLQQWMQRLVLDPDGVRGAVATDPSVDAVIAPSRSLSARARLGIYARMIRTRFHEALAEDFPALKALCDGEEPGAFAALCRDYLAAHPPASRTLNRLGAALPAFLRERPDADPWRAELAALEGSFAEVLAHHEEPPLAPAGLEAVLRSGNLGGVRFRTIAALRLHAFAFPVDAWFTAWGTAGHAASAPPPRPEPRPTWLAVFARCERARRLPLESRAFVLLRALRDGAALGDALEAAVGGTPGGAPAIECALAGWFRDWTAAGLFTAVE